MIVRRSLPLLLALAAAAATASPCAAQPFAVPEEVQALYALTEPVTIDGALTEKAWLEGLSISLDWETSPGHNLPAIVSTECYLAYDARAVYLGCRAYDPDPSSIRAHLTDRDAAWRDDYIGLMLDTFNDGRRAFGFYVNPLGVQMDIIRNDAGTGDEFDTSWDGIWKSAGRITPSGYEIEAAIPFTTLRFQRSNGIQTWGYFVQRNLPRNLRRQFASSAIDRNRNCLVCQMPKIAGFEDAHPGKNLELNPTLTASRTDARQGFPDGELVDGEADTDLGLTVLWGVTPNLTLAGTLNPDFSQVEADAPQVDVNRRFAIYYPEKRPFFLEGADFFDTFFSLVHTRNVVEPDWGAKLTGKEGGGAIGAFVAQDARTNLLIPGPEQSYLTTLPGSSTDAVARYRHDVGPGSAMGVLYAGRQGEDYWNHLAGIDAFLRLGGRHSVSLQVLGSQTSYPDRVVEVFRQPDGRFDGAAYLAKYACESRDFYVGASYEDVGDEFRADMGFMPQVGYRQYGAGGQRSWWGDSGEWYTRWFAGGRWGREETRNGGVLYDGTELWTGFEGPLQSEARYEFETRTRGYLGVEFDQTVHNLSLEMRPSGALDLYLWGRTGDDIDYAHVRPGTSDRWGAWAAIRVGRHLQLNVSHESEKLDLEEGTLYRVDQSELKVVYQLTARALVRAILQYEDLVRDPALHRAAVDPARETLVTQLLFSYKINPKTVLFAGYSDNSLGTNAYDPTRLDRTVFLKLGYAWVF